MEKISFEVEVEKTLEVLRNGGVILYPTDTVWGLGCDATNEKSVKRIFEIKRRADSKSMIVLVAEERDVLRYVAAPDIGVFDFINQQERPTTVVFDQAIGFPSNLIAEDGSIAIRIVRDEFCRHLVKRLRKPIVSTSANISGEPTAKSFAEISDEIKKQVDYIVQWRQKENKSSMPSQIIRWQNGQPVFIRS